MTKEELIAMGFTKSMSDWREYYVDAYFSLYWVGDGSVNVYCMSTREKLGSCSEISELEPLMKKGIKGMITKLENEIKFNELHIKVLKSVFKDLDDGTESEITEE